MVFSQSDGDLQTYEGAQIEVRRPAGVGIQGLMLITPMDSETGAPCFSCRKILQYDHQLPIRLPDEPGQLALEQLIALPGQFATVLISEDRVLQIGFLLDPVQQP